jgi:hypothetical protein
LSSCASPWKCRASNPAFSWRSWNNIFHPVLLWTVIFFWPCFLFVFPLQCMNQ